MNAEVLNKHEARFLDWLGRKHPRLKNYIVTRGDGQMGGFVDSLTANIDSILSGASKALGTYVKGKEQIDLVKINWERAKKGLAPFNSTEEARADMEGRISTSGFSGTALFKSPFFWLAVGVGAFFLIRGSRK